MPLMKKAELEGPSRKLYQDLLTLGRGEFDSAGSIGKRYRRQDEIGTPFCFTFDYDSLEDSAVTVRHRDTMKQERINISQVNDFLRDQLNKG